jgi:F420-dependent oxidoreductase-like protein
MPDAVPRQAREAATLRLPSSCLVVLIGPSASGKSTWAAANFRPSQVVASDALRGLVGESAQDQRAGTDAFDVLDLVVERRLRRGLLTVIDTLGIDGARRARYLEAAARHGVACHAVVFDTPAELCRRRNRERGRDGAVPPGVLAAQLSGFAAARPALAQEPFDGVHEPAEVEIVPPALVQAPELRTRQEETPMGLRFGLQLSSFHWPGGPGSLAGHLAEIATAAEDAGFANLWVMDHFLQIPQVGREWDEMLESYTALGFLAAATRRIRLGTLVTGVTYRNLAHLAKAVATLDVLSGGRAICGIGAAWYKREHVAYGWPFPPPGDRYRLLEDALQLLPLMWGPGSPPFEGSTTSVPETICYPRPLQEHLPILVGGGGERRTLRLAARYADACNLFGDAVTVRHKVEVLRAHCEEVGRPVEDVEVTHLGPALAASDRRELEAKVEHLRPPSLSPEAFSARTTAATVDDLIGHFRALAEAGVGTAIVSLPDVADPEALPRFAEVIAAFSGVTPSPGRLGS